jgi:hypothetical protein
MKVVGTGSPVMLTVRVRASEVGLLRDVLNEQLLAAAGSIGQAAPWQPSGVAVASARNLSDSDLAVVSELLSQLREPVAADQPRELVGPTSVLDPDIRTAASQAAERLCEAVDVFRADRGRMKADELRSALETASACTATLIGLDHAQNYAVQ